MSFDLGLKGARALVTGGTKGIGAAVVDALREAGARVVTTARTAPANARDDVHFIAADLMTAEGCARAAAGARDVLGGVDIIVHVVGGSSAPGGGFIALDDMEWMRELNCNLMAAVRLDRARCNEALQRRARGNATPRGRAVPAKLVKPPAAPSRGTRPGPRRRRRTCRSAMRRRGPGARGTACC